MKPPPQTTEEVIGPAVETNLHVWRRPATDDEMRPILGKVACSKLTPLEVAYERGQLKGGNPKYNEDARVNAGVGYHKIFIASEKGGNDSTQALNISRSCTLGQNNDAQERAWDSRLAIESHLSQTDRTIIRMVCGEEYAPAVAIRAACNDYKHTVAARLRESLDSLIEAMETARRHPGRFNMERRA
jgi:hypothetical protein